MNNEERANENRSSGRMLVGVGIVGLVCVLLAACNILPVPIQGNRMMLFGVTGILFLIFFVLGILSLKSAAIYAEQAAADKRLTETIKAWCDGNITAEGIDAEIADEPDAASSEEQYYKRIELMRRKITSNFLNLKEDFLENFLDDLYDTLYRDEKEETL